MSLSDEKSEAEKWTDEVAENLPMIIVALLIVIGVMLSVHLSTGDPSDRASESRVQKLASQVESIQKAVDEMPLQRHHEACLKFSSDVQTYDLCMDRYEGSKTRADVGVLQGQRKRVQQYP